MCVCMHACLYACMYAGMYVCIYIYIYIYMHIYIYIYIGTFPDYSAVDTKRAYLDKEKTASPLISPLQIFDFTISKI